MLRCQFLCYVLKTLFFIKIALKLSYFCKNFRALGAPPPDPRAKKAIFAKIFFCKKAIFAKIFERWGLRRQTPVPPAAGGSAPRPKT